MIRNTDLNRMADKENLSVQMERLLVLMEQTSGEPQVRPVDDRDALEDEGDSLKLSDIEDDVAAR